MAEKITFENGKISVPNNPIIPVIYGDGIGEDITPVMINVIDSAVEKAYSDEKKIEWKKVLAGEEANANKEGDWLPQETLNALEEHFVSIKGPLTTPVGGGFRSLNVTIRQKLDLYACVRPVRWFNGIPAPVKRPQDLDVVIFRENTEDIYLGVEWQEGTPEVKRVIDFLNNDMGKSIREDSGIGIKPISVTGSKRIIKSAFEYAKQHGRDSVTLVHKGNIMKFTEGAFKDWGYEVAEDYKEIEAKDVIADAMFQQLLLRPAEYGVIVTTNLNGDYLSDACAAQVGGLGIAPGANINYTTGVAVFEATHGTAPKYKGLDKVNPGSLILSAVMMLEHMGWQEAADLVIEGLSKTIESKRVTYDLERQMDGATLLKCSEFGEEIVKNM